MAFDAAWKANKHIEGLPFKNSEKKLEFILKKIEDHPFLHENPSQAREVAQFRIKLLNLEI